jgi:hypothetical protein
MPIEELRDKQPGVCTQLRDVAVKRSKRGNAIDGGHRPFMVSRFNVSDVFSAGRWMRCRFIVFPASKHGQLCLIIAKHSPRKTTGVKAQQISKGSEEYLRFFEFNC